MSLKISNPGLFDWHVEIQPNGNLRLEQEIYASRDGGSLSNVNSEKIVTVLEESVIKIKDSLGLSDDKSWLNTLAKSSKSVRTTFFKLALENEEIQRENFVWWSFDD